MQLKKELGSEWPKGLNNGWFCGVELIGTTGGRLKGLSIKVWGNYSFLRLLL